MHHPNMGDTPPPETIGNLQHAAWVPSSYNLGIRIFNVLNLLVQNAHRKIILSNVIDSSAATALIWMFELDQLHTWNALQHVSWRLANFLSMQKMTRIIIGHASTQLSQLFHLWQTA